MPKICDVEIRHTVLSSNPQGTLGERCAIISGRTNVQYGGLTYANPANTYQGILYSPSIGGCSIDALTPPFSGGGGVFALSIYGSDQGNFAVLMFGTPQSGLTVSVDSPVIREVNCRCDDTSCQVTCANETDGFCCIKHSFTNGLLTVLQG